MNIGNRLKKLRELKKIRQEDLAAMTGLTQVRISSYENGGSFPPIAKLEKIVKSLGLTMAEFFSEDENKAASEPASSKNRPKTDPLVLNKANQELLRAFITLTPSQQKAVRQMIKEMALK